MAMNFDIFPNCLSKNIYEGQVHPVTLKCAKDSFSLKGVLFAKRTTLKCAKDFLSRKEVSSSRSRVYYSIEMFQKDK